MCTLKHTMSKEQTFRDYNLEKELQRAKWFKEDLDKGGWREVHKGPNVNIWTKTFPGEEIPVKILYSHVLPMSVKKYCQLADPLNIEFRKKWDKSCAVIDVLEKYPHDGGYTMYTLKKFPWPMADRDFVAFIQLHKEIDWYGKKSTLIVLKNAWHLSKPENVDGVIRTTHVENFIVATPDDNEPETACKVLGLSCNNYNGYLPKFFVTKAIPRIFNKGRQDIIKGFKTYADDLQ